MKEVFRAKETDVLILRWVVKLMVGLVKIGKQLSFYE